MSKLDEILDIIRDELVNAGERLEAVNEFIGELKPVLQSQLGAALAGDAKAAANLRIIRDIVALRAAKHHLAESSRSRQLIVSIVSVAIRIALGLG